jgi:hypothetical protein
LPDELSLSFDRPGLTTREFRGMPRRPDHEAASGEPGRHQNLRLHERDLS